MSAFVPTSLLTLQRGHTVDEFGDEVAAATVVAEHLPAAVTEIRQRRYDPDEQRGGVVEEYSIRLRPTADAREGDRLVDEHDGSAYQVRAVSNPRSVVGMADVRATAVRVGALSQPVNG